MNSYINDFVTIINKNQYDLKETLIAKSNFLDNLNSNMDYGFFDNDNIKHLFFQQDEQKYVEILCNPEIFDECQFYDAIYFFEDKKNEYRCKDKEFFEFYDKLQELFYKKMELIYPNEKDELMTDCWNKPN